jgi:hypothetical protein
MAAFQAKTEFPPVSSTRLTTNSSPTVRVLVAGEREKPALTAALAGIADKRGIPAKIAPTANKVSFESLSCGIKFVFIIYLRLIKS